MSRPTREPKTPTRRMADPGDAAEVGDAPSFSEEQRDLLAAAEFAICVATFYGELAERLVNGAVEGFAVAGVAPTSVHTYEVPGAFELPLAAHWCADSGRFAGVACLGAVIRGETSHYDHVCNEAARGIQDVQLRERRSVCVRRHHLRDDGAGARALRRRQAGPGPQRGERGDADGAAQARRLLTGARYHPPSRWRRCVTAAARGPRSGTPEATPWSPPGDGSTPTCRRSGSPTADAPGACTSAPGA